MNQRRVLICLVLLVLGSCSPSGSAWVQPSRVINVPVDVRKALIIASSSSVLSEYGPLAGALVEMLPKDLGELHGELVNVDWSTQRCVWTFDTAIEAVSVRRSIMLIRFTHQEGTGVRFWFFDKKTLGPVKKIEFE